MADLGLLEGLASGLREGLGAYQQARKQRLAEEQQRRQNQIQDAQLKAQGYLMNPDGSIELGTAQQGKLDLENQTYDPNSELSKTGVDVAGGIANQAGLGGKIKPGMSLGQVNKLEDWVKQGIGLKKDQYRAQSMSGRQGMQQSRLEETQNQNAVQAGKAFDTDKIIQGSKVSKNSLDRASSILDNPNKPVTAKDLNLAYTDYINAVAAGGAATEGKIQRELPETWAIKLNELMQQVGANNDLRSTNAGKELISMLKENIRTVHHDLHLATSDQARLLHDNYVANSNSKVKETIKQKLKTYAPEAYAEIYGGPKGKIKEAKTPGLINADAMSKDDEDALNWVNDPANAKDPAREGVIKKLKSKGIM